MKQNLLFTVLVLSIGWIQVTFAGLIVDTGAPTNIDTQWSFHGNSTSELWWAGQFTLDQSCVLTDIDYYLTPRYAGTVTVAIYDGSGVPTVGDELYFTTFQGTNGGPTDWYGVSDLDWFCTDGTYWIAFEARNIDNYYSTLPSDVPSPMDAVAAYRGGYILETPETFGVRISGNPVAVPAPGALCLLSIGIAAVTGIRRRKFHGIF